MCVYFFAQFQGENYRLKITKRQNQDETWQQQLSIVVSYTSRLSGIRTHNFS
jgi:hypothetical protein